MPRSTPRPAHPPHRAENVPASWLVKAVGGVLLAAIACIYLTLCLLYYQGQWQIVLHPVRATSQPPASANLVRFAPNDAGQTQLAGKLLAAPAGSRYSGLTIFFLAGGDGSLSDSTATITALQGIGLNVFAFDYRGYGLSVNIHPSQQRMTEDTEAAWRYLTSTRGLSPARIIPYGTGVGASLAAELAALHREIPALILDAPHTDLLDVARSNSPALLPVGLLFHERFPLREPLTSLRTPKLLIADDRVNVPAAFIAAADPKITVTLPVRTGTQFDQSVTRFLDQYLQAVPTPAPSGTNPR